MRRRIKVGLKGLTPAKLVKKTEDIVLAMTGNANFPNPTPDLADITTANQELKLAVTEAGYDKRAIFRRDALQTNVINMLRELGTYVALMTKGDGDIIVSSGFEVRRQPETMPPLSRPVNFVANRGAHEGTAILEWKTVRGSQTYLIQVTTTDPSTTEAVWETAGMTSKVKHRLDNLVKGTHYWYRVQALGRNSVSPFSDLSMLFAA